MATAIIGAQWAATAMLVAAIPVAGIVEAATDVRYKTTTCNLGGGYCHHTPCGLAPVTESDYLPTQGGGAIFGSVRAVVVADRAHDGQATEDVVTSRRNPRAHDPGSTALAAMEVAYQ
jgi:hypothetical protein